MSTPSLLWHPATWAVVSVGLLVGLGVAITHTEKAAPPLEDYGPIAPFALVDQTGKPTSDADLKGTTWVGDFIFTSCPDACPALTATLSGLLPRLPAEGVRLISFSVDPETDTPAVLTEWSAQFHPDPARWSFLTGSPDAVRAALAGLKVASEKVNGPSGASLVHTEKFLLVDKVGHLRGFYSVDKAGLDALVADVERVVAAP